MPIDNDIAPSAVSSNPASDQRIEQLRTALVAAKASILAAQERQRRYADRHRRDVSFSVGDRVLLSTEHLKVVGDRRSPKLHSKYIGPFRITRIVGSNAYELDLPLSMKIHPVLNVSRLKSYRDGSITHPHRAQPHHRPPPECDEDGAEVFEVERVLEKRGSNSRLEYLVEWKGYPRWEATWTSRRDMGGAADAIAEFEVEYANRRL